MKPFQVALDAAVNTPKQGEASHEQWLKVKAFYSTSNLTGLITSLWSTEKKNKKSISDGSLASFLQGATIKARFADCTEL